MKLNCKNFVHSLTPEQAKDFLMNYFKAEEEQEHILEFEGFKYTINKIKDIIDKRIITRQNSFIVNAGQKTINTGLTDLGNFSEIYINGRRLYPTTHYTVDKPTGLVTLTFTPEYDMNGFIIDGKVNIQRSIANADTLQGKGLLDFITKENFSDEVVKLRRYDEITLQANDTVVQSRLTPLSGRPTVIIDGKFGVLGKDYEMTDRGQGLITIKNPPQKEYTVVINDLTFTPGADLDTNAQTLNGLGSHQFVRGLNVFEMNTLGEAKSSTFLKDGDRVRVWGNKEMGDTYVAHYLVVSEEQPEYIELENGKFLKPLVFFVNSESGELKSNTNTYTLSVLKELNQFTEVYIDGVFQIYGRDWNIEQTEDSILKIKFAPVEKDRIIHLVNRTNVQDFNIGTLNGKTENDFLMTKREFSFSTLQEMKSFEGFQVNDRISLWGKESVGDENVKKYVVIAASDNEPTTEALSQGLYGKLILDNTVKIHQGDIPTQWYNTLTCELDMHGHTHITIGTEFDSFGKEITIKKIINLPKNGLAFINRKGGSIVIKVEGNDTGITFDTHNILMPVAVNDNFKLGNGSTIIAYRPLDVIDKCLVVQLINPTYKEENKEEITFESSNQYAVLKSLDTYRWHNKLNEMGLLEEYETVMNKYDSLSTTETYSDIVITSRLKDIAWKEYLKSK